MDRNNISANYHIRVRESLSARRAWIEMTSQVPTWFGIPSLSARRAWIEIAEPRKRSDVCRVALRKESVDRNSDVKWKIVATYDVALRKESVDRNIKNLPEASLPSKSLSARRAWIEILPSKQCAEIAKRRSPQGERG